MFKNDPFAWLCFAGIYVLVVIFFFKDSLMTGEVIDVAQIWIIKILKRKQTQMDFGLVPTLNTTLKEKM